MMQNENDSYVRNVGFIIPSGVAIDAKGRKIKMQRNGWNVLFMKRWVGIKRYKRIVPVRQDLIIDFLWWRFVKPLYRQIPKWTDNPDGSKTWTLK